MFQNTLTRAGFWWFLNLGNTKARNWEDICREFHNQYKYNIEMDVVRRDLETTKQAQKEPLLAYITKWRSKATQMMNRPNEEEQLTIVIKNVLLYTINIYLLNIFQTLRP